MFESQILSLRLFWESVKDHKTTISVSTGTVVLVAIAAFLFLF